MTDEPLRVLLAEDSEEDAELVERMLRHGGLVIEPRVAESEGAFREALATFAPDLILADWALPGFSGEAAVAIAREWDAAVPCILVSGTLGEELVVKALRTGATDYVLKQRLEALVPAVRRALAETAERRERERLEAELRRFREMTTETFERMPYGFLAIDGEQRITYANPAALGLVDVRLEDAVGRRPWELFPEFTGSQFQAAEAQMSAGAVVEYEEYFGPRNTWVDVLACPASFGTAIFVRDVSDRKRSEEAVHASEALLRGSLDAMFDPFVICSSVRDDAGAIDGFRVDFANRAASASMGLAPDSLIGARLPDTMPILRGKRFSDICLQVVESGEVWAEDSVEFAVPGRDGAALGALSIQVARFGDGFLAVWRDVTEHERLARERERLAAVVEESPDGILIRDGTGHITYANAAYLAVIGHELPDIVGQQMPAVMVEGIDPAMVADIVRTVTGGEPWHGEIDQPYPDGTTHRIELSITPRRDPDGVISSWLNVLHDVTSLREAEGELDLQARIRAALAESVHAIPTEATVEETAQTICEQLVTLSFVDVAAIEVFGGAGDVQIMAQSAPPGYPVPAGTQLPPARAALVRERAARGPWAQFLTADPAEGWIPGDVAAGLKALAYGPIVHGDHVDGVLVIGTFDERLARTLVEKVPGIVSFSTTSSALLAERLHAVRREADLRESIAAVLAARAFHPVYQPIVDLESGDLAGYEALTRFDSGQRPDRCFADAWAVGLGPELELATLEAAVAGGKRLPPGHWLDLNISPRLLADPERLSALLWPAERPLILEITEHELIEDYGAVREAIRALGHDVRLAVDDAGAGVANFGHIIELRPDFVKLDMGLVRRVNANLGRQAMVVGMRHFSRTAGCRLVAEGIESEAEAETLRGLGVEFGQGYLFGRPEPVDVWAAAAGTGGGDRPPVVPVASDTGSGPRA